MGVYVKTVFVMLFDGLPNRFLLVGVIPFRGYCLILYLVWDT